MADTPEQHDPPEQQPSAAGMARVERLAGHLRSEQDLDRLARYAEHMALPLVLAAILPIVVAASGAALDSRVSIVVSIVSWLVFVLDLAVYMRYVRGYLRTGAGMFDLAIVVLTAPWFLIPGLGGSQILVLARLARLARLLMVSSGARRAFQRLGRVGLFAIAMLLFASWMAYTAEKSVNPEFADFGDALWWGIVTLTTVGYGDIVPVTTQGRLAGVFLMLTGLGTLGVISGTMASLFRSSSKAETAAQGSQGAGPPPALTPDPVAVELAALRAQLVALEAHLGVPQAEEDPR